MAYGNYGAYVWKNGKDVTKDCCDVPYIYKEAEQYYYKIFEAQKKNINKNINQEVIEITITPPEKDNKIKLFNLDMEDNDNNE